jgi:tetratricopeptide (TPR) repeat protein
MDPFVRLKLRLAWDGIKRNDLTGARQEVEEAIEARGRSAPLQSLLAEITRREGRADDAAAIAREVLGAYGPDPVAAGVLGKIQLEAGRPAEALPFLEDAYRLRPGAYAAEAVVDALVALKRHDAAQRVLTDALNRFPGIPRLLRRAVRLHEQAGRTGEAIEVLGELLRADPGNAWARRKEIELKSADRPAEDVGRLLGIGSRGRDPNLRGLHAKKLRDAGDFAGAGREYAEAAKLAPENDYWRKQAGFAFARARLDEEAVRFLRPLFLTGPDDVYVRNALFAALKRRGGGEAVAAVIDEALAQHPDKGFLHGLQRKFSS